jgi:hypothetical protein
MIGYPDNPKKIMQKFKTNAAQIRSLSAHDTLCVKL